MDKLRNLRAGDILICTTGDYSNFTRGKKYKVIRKNITSYDIENDEGISKGWYIYESEYKLVKPRTSAYPVWF